MMNAKDAKATALAVVTFLIRPFLMLLVGLGVGYGIGFTDAYRESDTLGDKVARQVYRVRPEAVSQSIYRRATVIRDTMHAKAGVNIDPLAPVDTTRPPY
jgi:hypothetical protein